MRKYVQLASLFLFGIAFSLAQEAGAWGQTNTPTAKNSCIKCHAEVGDELAAPIAQVESDVHGRRGFSCASL